MTPTQAFDPAAKLGLGTAQFGLDYAPSAPRGRSPEIECGDILQIAARARVPLLDAAGGFGRTETVLGEKMPRPCPFKVVLRTARADRGADFVEAEARASLARLQLDRAYAILVQSAGDLFGPHGPALWDRLKRLRDEGLVERIGVSVYASDDPKGVARRFRPDIIQAPASLLDQRLIADGTLAGLAGLGIEVHLRSIFLQGMLFLPAHRMPAHLQQASRSLSRVRRMIAEGRSDPLQAALGWALSRPEAAHVVVGVTTAAELQAVLAAAATPPPELDWDEMALDDPSALDAARVVAA
ncbi:MAG TPA: aldo/keto reductase [Caulobacteraceae bacterium]|jgi:aryl-alcohol dehydrogenase-like predicted oxidoreductase